MPGPQVDYRTAVERYLADNPDMAARLKASEARKLEARRMAGLSRSGRYWDDPIAWARDCIKWPDGKFLAPYQQEVMAAVVERRRVAVRGPRGLGKTMVCSLIVLWFAITREQAGVDWKIPTLASVGDQLRLYFWPEIRKWANRLDWERIGVEPWRRGRELQEEHIKLRFGEASAITGADPSSIEGAHASELLYCFDEAKAIPDAFFDSAEGAFSTAGLTEGTNAYAVAISTPGEPVGRFYNIHKRAPGTQKWWARHVTIDEAVRAGRVTSEWVEEQRLLWGEASAVFQNHVLGEFAASSEDSVIPLAWVEAAQYRWRQRYEDVDPVTGERRLKGKARAERDGTASVLAPGEKLHTVGVDVAYGGEDSTVFALRQGNTICEIRRYAFTDNTQEIARLVTAVQNGHGDPKAIVDSIGYGAGVYDGVREEGKPSTGFNSSEGTKRTDVSSEFGFNNKRSWAWWNLREMLEPGSGCDVALPPDDMLTGDLTTPKWKPVAGGRIAVEQKADIKKRLGRSTDSGDAVVYAFTESGGSWGDLYRSQADLDAKVAEEEESGIDQPRQRQALRRGWADVYKSDEQLEAERQQTENGGPPALPMPRHPQRSPFQPQPRPNGGWFGR